MPLFESSSGRYAATDMTRLLCAGARLDPTFSTKVIDLLLDNRQQFAAPAYGYDAVPVLGHALDARRMRRVRTAALVLSIVVILILMIFGPVGFIGGLLLLVWATWTSIFVERLVQLHTVVRQLRRESVSGREFTGEYPSSELLTGSVARDIVAEQDTRSLVYYGGYLPFVGSGRRERDWSFAVLLDTAATLDPLAAGNGSNGPARAAQKFTVAELTDYVHEHLELLLQPESAEGGGIEELDISRRWYGKAVDVRRPTVPQEADSQLSQHGNGPGRYDSTREYLCIRVGSWDQELVTTVFVNFDVKGRMLYTELNGYVLPPIKPKFRLVDRLPGTVTGDIVGRLAWHATKSILRDLVGLPVAAFNAIYRLLWGKKSDDVLDAEDLTRYANGVSDYGAKASVRELAAISGYRHFFQQVDANKYTTIIERRLFEVILDFLEAQNVDTTEFRARQQTVLNYGIIHSGTGDVVNQGTQAFGPKATAAQGAATPTN